MNRDVHRNDLTDLCLTLYVGNQDVVVTDDRLLKALFSQIDPWVRVVSADAL